MVNTSPTRRVCVVGSGTHFLSGISYYTHRLAHALNARHPTSAILMRQLVPTRFYPGKSRVGKNLAPLDYGGVAVFDGVDWFALPSLAGAIRALRAQRPEVVVFQWWTGAVLHNYIALATAAKRLGAKVVLEFHEIQDVGESTLPLASMYVNTLSPLLLKQVDGFIVHSRYDLPEVVKRYRVPESRVAVIPHGPYDQYDGHKSNANANIVGSDTSDSDITRLLFFGVIRPYKGLEHLIRAFSSLSDDEAERFHLTVVGETWEDWTLPGELIAKSRHKERITFVNRYVPDEEVQGYFKHADAVVLPYLRSSASGPLNIAMSLGLPVVITEVGGLTEAVENYGGAVTIPPGDEAALRAALFRAAELKGSRFGAPHSWEETTSLYSALFDRLFDRALSPRHA